VKSEVKTKRVKMTSVIESGSKGFLSHKTMPSSRSRMHKTERKELLESRVLPLDIYFGALLAETLQQLVWV
jgi:hypothetical protein